MTSPRPSAPVLTLGNVAFALGLGAFAPLLALLPGTLRLLAFVPLALLATRPGPASVRLALPVLAIELTVLCVVRLAGWWRCDVACQGGGHYQQLAGVSVVWPALAAYAVLAVLAIRDAQRGAWCPWLVRLVWLYAGGSLFFLWVSQRLGLVCPFCLTIHGTMAMALICARPLPAGMRWWDLARWLGLGFLLLNLAFHHQVVPDVEPARPSSGSDDGMGGFMGAPRPDGQAAAARASAAYRAADTGRIMGDAGARWRIELVIDPHCQTCAEEHAPLLAAFKPLLARVTPPVAVVTRLLTRPSDPSGADLVRHLLAAAALGSGRFQPLLSVVLGAPAGIGFAGMRSRIAEIDDPDAIAAALVRDQAAIQQLLADDAARLRALGAVGATPQVILVDGASGPSATSVVKRWSGQVDAPTVAAEIAALLAH
jgi:hypothetical protein